MNVDEYELLKVKLKMYCQQIRVYLLRIQPTPHLLEHHFIVVPIDQAKASNIMSTSTWTAWTM